MTNQQKEQLVRLRSEGCSYTKIASILSLSENTVKSFYNRNKVENPVSTESTVTDNSCCQQCGRPIKQREKVKQRRFCSDACRMAWWNAHQEKVIRKSIYNIVCVGCNQPFASYGNKTRKYCSRNCYFRTRFGGDQ